MTPDDLNRRRFVRNTGLGALTFTVGGTVRMLTPRAAAAEDIGFAHLTRTEAGLLAQFAEHLLPGAAAAGVAHFVDHQLGAEPNECLLMCKYFPEIKAPFASFYRAGLAALAAASQSRFSHAFEGLEAEQKNSLTDSLWKGDIDPWSGPPPPLFYMMVRSDAVDVVYGTKEGFDQLNVPYMAHIMPRERW